MAEQLPALPVLIVVPSTELDAVLDGLAGKWVLDALRISDMTQPWAAATVHRHDELPHPGT